MKNGHMPAMPTQVNGGDLFGGLTKREQFAMSAMQGLLVNMGRNGFDTVEQVADEACRAADALLDALASTSA